MVWLKPAKSTSNTSGLSHVGQQIFAIKSCMTSSYFIFKISKSEYKIRNWNLKIAQFRKKKRKCVLCNFYDICNEYLSILIVQLLMTVDNNTFDFYIDIKLILWMFKVSLQPNDDFLWNFIILFLKYLFNWTFCNNPRVILMSKQGLN